MRSKQRPEPVRCRRCHRKLTDPDRAVLRIGLACQVLECAEKGLAMPAGISAARIARILAAARGPGPGQQSLFDIFDEEQDEMTVETAGARRG